MESPTHASKSTPPPHLEIPPAAEAQLLLPCKRLQLSRRHKARVADHVRAGLGRAFVQWPRAGKLADLLAARRAAEHGVGPIGAEVALVGGGALKWRLAGVWHDLRADGSGAV